MIRCSTPLVKLAGLNITGCDTNEARIATLSYSRGHAVAVLSNGDVAATGDNSSCQLGTGSQGNSAGFSRVLIREKSVAAAAGADFTLVIGESGALFSCGIERQTVQPSLVRNVLAAKLSVYKNTVAILAPDNSLKFWPHFHKLEAVHSPTLFTTPIEVACGDGFVAVLLENGLLVNVSEKLAIPLIVPSLALQGGERFTAVSAAENYIIAIDEARRAWIFGDFCGFSPRYLATTPVFRNVLHVFAFPTYACAIDAGHRAHIVGRAPANLAKIGFAKQSKRIEAVTDEVGFAAGNDDELVLLPMYCPRDVATRQGKADFPPRLFEGLPIVPLQ
jgi:hypothetical protein